MAIEILKNNSILEITGKNNIIVTSKTLKSGFAEQRKQFSFSGRVKMNKPTVIASMKVTAAENKKFLKSPGIELKQSNRIYSLGSNLKMKLTGTEKDSSGNITIYLYDLVYTGKENISKINKLKYTFSNKTAKLTSKISGIEKVDFGRVVISRNGEKRKITVHGTPGTTFKIAVNKFIDGINTNLTAPNNIVNSFERSILSEGLYNSDVDNIFNAKRHIIGSSGKYSFIQTFPFLSDTDFTNGLGRYSINIYSTSYKSNFNNWIKNRQADDYFWSNPNGTWYSKILKQKSTATVKLRATINNVLYTINRQVIPDGASTQTYDLIYPRKKDNVVVQYVLKPVSSSHSFSSTGKTVTSSDWTGSVGDTNIKLNNFSLTLSSTDYSNDTATFTFNVKVDNRGTSDVTLTFAVNSLVNCS